MHEKAWRLQFGEMLAAKLGRLAWRMQGIRKQKQSADEPGLVSAQHGGLAATVRVSAEKDTAWGQLAKCNDRLLETFAIACGVARPWRPKRSLLTIGQIVAENHETRAGKGFCKSLQKRGLAIRSRAVGEDKTISVRRRGLMEKSADSRIERAIVKRSDGQIAHVEGMEDLRLSSRPRARLPASGRARFLRRHHVQTHKVRGAGGHQRPGHHAQYVTHFDAAVPQKLQFRR